MANQLSKHDDAGEHVGDHKVALPVQFNRPQSLEEMVRRYTQQIVSEAARRSGEETFEEADDFEVGDEPELRSPYELSDEQSRATPFIEEEPAPAPPITKKDASGAGGKPPKTPKKPKTTEPEDDEGGSPAE